MAKKRKVATKAARTPVKKTVKKKPAAKKAVKRRVVKKPAAKKQGVVGKVTHYFPKVQVAVIKLKAPLALKDLVHIQGHTTNFTQEVGSIQFDHISLAAAKKGQEVGVQVISRVRRGDEVVKV